jgi:hypothetical protein
MALDADLPDVLIQMLDQFLRLIQTGSAIQDHQEPGFVIENIVPSGTVLQGADVGAAVSRLGYSEPNVGKVGKRGHVAILLRRSFLRRSTSPLRSSDLRPRVGAHGPFLL